MLKMEPTGTCSIFFVNKYRIKGVAVRKAIIIGQNCRLYDDLGHLWIGTIRKLKNDSYKFEGKSFTSNKKVF